MFFYVDLLHNRSLKKGSVGGTLCCFTDDFEIIRNTERMNDENILYENVCFMSPVLVGMARGPKI